MQQNNKKTIHRLYMVYFRRPWLYPDFIFYLTPRGLQFKRDCDYVHNLSKDIVEKRRMMLVKLCVAYYILFTQVNNKMFLFVCEQNRPT